MKKNSVVKKDLGFTVSIENVFHRTPYVLNWISIFLVGYATYQPVVMEWVHAAPFGTLEAKDMVMSWLDWACPMLGLLIQFTRKNSSVGDGN